MKGGIAYVEKYFMPVNRHLLQVTPTSVQQTLESHVQLTNSRDRILDNSLVHIRPTKVVHPTYKSCESDLQKL